MNTLKHPFYSELASFESLFSVLGKKLSSRKLDQSFNDEALFIYNEIKNDLSSFKHILKNNLLSIDKTPLEKVADVSLLNLISILKYCNDLSFKWIPLRKTLLSIPNEEDKNDLLSLWSNIYKQLASLKLLAKNAYLDLNEPRSYDSNENVAVAFVINSLVTLADSLDNDNLTKHANSVDAIIKKLSSF